MSDLRLTPIETICAHAVVGAALSRASEWKLLDQIVDQKVREGDLRFPGKRPSDLAISAVLDSLSAVGVLQRENGLVCPGPNLTAAQAQGEFAQWFFSGYGPLLADGTLQGEPEGRNSLAVACAGARYGVKYVDPILFEQLERLTFKRVLDLGCGRGDRLRQICSRFDVCGIGIDSDAKLVAEARRLLNGAEFSERVSFEAAEVGSDAMLKLTAEVDVVTCFFLGHDLWPRQSCVNTFRRLRLHLGHVQAFLFGDTYRVERPLGASAVPFIPAFRFVHGLRGEYIPTFGEWKEVFAASGWICREVLPLGIPDSDLFVLVPGPLQDAQ